MIEPRCETQNPISGLNPNQIRGALIGLGYSSIPNFAAAHGFKPTTVANVIYRYAGNPDARPQGIQTARILAAINSELTSS